MTPPAEERWPRVAVIGAGAVGCYFGGMMARAGAQAGAAGRVTFIGRPRELGAAPAPPSAHIETLERDGLFLDGVHVQEKIAVAASARPDAVRDADLVLFCVKTVDTEEAARAIAPHLKPGAIVVSLQNGVDNAERIRATAEIDALPAVVYVAAAIAAPGRVKHSGRGDLVLGHPRGSSPLPAVEQAAAWLTRAGIPCRISANIESELWVKLVMNCAGNAVTALARASYGQVARHALTRELVRATAEEAIAVARAAGIEFPQVDFIAAALKLAQELGDATSSTSQDIQRGRRTEIDSLNGYVARRGAALGVPTPVNHTLFVLVKLLEESVSRS